MYMYITQRTLLYLQWKALSETERVPYNESAKKDRERYNKECAERDQEMLQQQEERRKKNEVGDVLSVTKRSTTQAASDTSQIKAIKELDKKPKILSAEETRAKEQKQEEKRVENETINKQKDEIKKSKASQAEARLKFLLNQSDIFSHFGNGKGSQATDSDVKASTSSSASQPPGSVSKRSRESKNDLTELDADEKAMMGEGDESDNIQPAVVTRQPSIITGGKLREYQIEGLQWMVRLCENGINGILADEMGLGKTLQSVSIIAYMREFKNITGPHLIMVPKSTLSNWMNEFQRFCPCIRTIRFHGAKEDREIFVRETLQPTKMHSERGWDVCVTTYEVCNMERTALQKIAWRHLIIDEAHRLKNEASQFAQTVRLMETQHRLLLTGTPLQNNLHELWALLNFLLPDVFHSSDEFDEWFNLDVDDKEAKERMISQLHKLLRPFMLRRLKADVEKALLPKTETILFTGMSAVQKNLYKSILMRDIDTINGASKSKSEASRTAVLNIVMQLRKCCNHPYLFPGVEDRTLNPMAPHLYENCGKMVLLDKLLAKLKERGHRVLIFSQMTKMLDILEDYVFMRGYGYCRIDGNTSYEDREDRIYSYNAENSDKFVFLLSTRAGGLGINLQTADIVILYDSDWNPQADLQAQDRAHRIGQKKAVQVFRLVTDDTVEVKVVERAQQKLKLDAMVVQQGRLQENDKKMSKTDLLDTLRFGADKIFKSKDSSITDDDIDTILDQGKKRTEEMNSSLADAEKGDMYDFRLDGGMNSQVFDGKDYSNKQFRDNEKDQLLAMQMQFLDTGKRERKAISSYSETIARLSAEQSGGQRKIPRHLKLPKMDDFQFYNKRRLQELADTELAMFESKCEDPDYPPHGTLNKLVVLPPDLMEEKEKLISQGFANWNKSMFNTFIRLCGRYGRDAHDRIAIELDLPVDEIQRYSKAFWELGPTVFAEGNVWDRHWKSIKKGEDRLDEIQRLESATAQLISVCSNPWEELSFKYSSQQGRTFREDQDRYLLCFTQIHGYGNWDKVRQSITKCDKFKFDYYLNSCSSDAIGKRCETLMKSAERELQERLKKNKGAITEAFPILSQSFTNKGNAELKEITKPITATGGEKRTMQELHRDKLVKLNQEIKEESAKLSALRKELSMKTLGKEGSTTGKTPKKVNGDTEPEVSSKGGLPTGGAKRPVPDKVLPELCELILTAGADGKEKIRDKLLERYPNISRRQAEETIQKIGIKEKRPGDVKIVWYIKAEYEHLLREGARGTSSSGGGANKKAKVGGSSPADSNKRARESEKPLEDPKKPKTAFSIFVKEHRKQAEHELGEGHSKDALKQLLLRKWEMVDAAGGQEATKYIKMAQEDEARYKKEMTQYTKELEQRAKKVKKEKYQPLVEGSSNNNSTAAQVPMPP